MTFYVLYHANCRDGIAAMHVARKYFKETRFQAKYFPVQYHQPCPILDSVTQEDSVLILDFSYSRDILLQLHDKVAGKIKVLDHHKTAQEDLSHLPFAEFDMEHSGAFLAWRYFFPDKPTPWVVKYVEDRDLWNWKYPDTKVFNEGLTFLLEDTFQNDKTWQHLLDQVPTVEDSVVEQGRTLVQKMEADVASSLRQVEVVTYGGHRVGIVNSTSHASELGNAVCTNAELSVDYAVVYSILPKGEVLLSFRSVGNFDVSAIAKTFGGGGHKNASGAKINMATLFCLLDNRVTND